MWRRNQMIKNPIGDWIPVETALPQRLERVLVVCYNYNNRMQTHVSLCTFWGKSSKNGRLVWSGNKCVSHWMPLPELPKDFKQNPRLKED